MGGTFDPPHLGHLLLAVESRYRLDLDRVLLVVANDPWQKQGRTLANAQDRMAMALLAAEGIPGVEVSGLEIERGGPSYTIDTVAQLENTDRDLYLVLGADAASGVDTWHRSDELARRVRLAVAARAGSPGVVPPGWRGETFEFPIVDISSTEIRRRLAVGDPVDVWVPAPVISFAVARGLYRGAQMADTAP